MTEVLNVKNLKSFTNYSIHISISNRVSESNPYFIGFVKTNESIPDHIENLEIEEIGIYHIKIKWNLPLQMNGIIKKYVVRIKNKMYSETFSTILTKHDFVNLNESTTYNISVQAQNNVGLGDVSSITVDTFDLTFNENEIISIVGFENTDTGLLVKWYHNGQYTNPSDYYYVYYTENELEDLNNWTKSKPIYGVNRITLSNVKKGMKYYFVVASVDGRKNVMYSEKISFTLPAQVFKKKEKLNNQLIKEKTMADKNSTRLTNKKVSSINLMKFNEDGSFIGVYGNNKENMEPNANSTPISSNIGDSDLTKI
ncbi:hypothetical protein A3Q56_01710 [Intoshia linei]|uniref:Fibronectin type-III domain-containing protein n=1 Tax=Intoshia linei TaxID=1819745 RepID=A0A177B8Q0_9BILA|nr:hypothetical protein A3Q56_01710 [Intoshia linei]